MRYDSLVEAFVLKQQPLGETDVLGTWFTRELGKVRGVVTGARRPQSRLSAALLPGTILQVRLVGRHDKGLFTIAGTRNARVLIPAFTEAQTWVYMWVLEAISKAVPDAEPNSALFTAIELLFGRIAQMHPGDEAYTSVLFLVNLLDVLGIAPQPGLAAGTVRWFDPNSSSFVAELGQAGVISIDPAVYDRYVQLRALQVDEPQQVDAAVVRLLEQVLERYLERPLRSFSFVNDIL